jgi:cell division protein FtsW
VGGIFVLLLYLVLLFRAVAIMVAIPQSFGGFLSFGLAFMMVMQAMVNMGVAVGLLPVTGQPLPFVSWGGSSMMFTGLSIGIILSVSKEINKNKEKRNELETAQDNN